MPSAPLFLTAKIVIRCASFEASRRFYAGVLHLPIVEQFQEEQGRGCTMSLGDPVSGTLLEIYEMSRADKRWTEAFTQPVSNDKIDLQVRTEDLDAWVDALEGHWPFEGPEDLPWGQRWIKLRDPDGFLIAICENV
jgi:catechol 2,3-dioxygenase-like lactoylglutathione lyase family enzyme